MQRDLFIEAVRADDFYTSYEWECLNKHGVTQRYKGCWILCDQGYLPWGAQICAFSSVVSGTAMGAWNSLVGSARKDVECAFGALKKRFRILRLPFLYRPTHKIGTIFRVCAILHNMLLEFDGLADIGQEEWHWISKDNAQTMQEMRVAGMHGPVSEERDYSYLTTAFNPYGRPGTEDEMRHHLLKDALLEHYTYSKSVGQLRWPKTDAQAREEESDLESITRVSV